MPPRRSPRRDNSRANNPGDAEADHDQCKTSSPPSKKVRVEHNSILDPHDMKALMKRATFDHLGTAAGVSAPLPCFGTLVSLFPSRVGNLVLKGPSVCVGTSGALAAEVADLGATVLFRVHPSPTQGVLVMDQIHGNGVVSVNRRLLSKNKGPATVPIRPGDEVSIATRPPLRFVFMEGDVETATPMEKAKVEGSGGDSVLTNECMDRITTALLSSLVRPTPVAQLPEVGGEGFDYPYLDSRIVKQLQFTAEPHIKRADAPADQRLDWTGVPAVANRVLLVGEIGTEKYQYALAQRLASVLDCNFLPLCEVAREIAQLTDPAPRAPTPPSDSENGVQHQEMDTLAISFFGMSDFITANRKGPRRLAVGDRVKQVSVSTGGERDKEQMTGPPLGSRGVVVGLFEGNDRRVAVRYDKPVKDGHSCAGACESPHGYFASLGEISLESEGEQTTEASQIALVRALQAVLHARGSSEPSITPCLVYISDPESCGLRTREVRKAFLELASGAGAVFLATSTTDDLARSPERQANSFRGMAGGGGLATGLHGPVDMISVFEPIPPSSSNAERHEGWLAKVFPARIEVHPPSDRDVMMAWKARIKEDVERVRAEDNARLIVEGIRRAGATVGDGQAAVEAIKGLRTYKMNKTDSQRVVGWALGQFELKGGARGGAVAISDVERAVELMMDSRSESHHGPRSAHRDVIPDNEFEKKLLAEVIGPGDLGVKFDHIGALKKTKQSLWELVMLPLKRPKLFQRGTLTRPCRGILLFGPPGTGKTMLAKAVATEAGASFINVSMSAVGSKWFGEVEKYVRAVFSLASKLAPCVVFVDEVDSLLGRRESSGEHEAMRKLKNEFMAQWDGMKTDLMERVVVLGATNRPFDLDDAVLRRFPRRYLVDVPDVKERTEILRTVLKSETVAWEEGDLDELARDLSGYVGSDLYNLCTAAAYRPIRELIQKEKEGKEVEEDPELRALVLADFKAAKNDVPPGVTEDSPSVAELRRWNEQYGDGNSSRGRAKLSYFM